MWLRRLVPSAGRGVVASGVGLLLTLALAGCSSSTPRIQARDLDPADRADCEALLADLPDTLAGQRRVTVEPEGALGAAWGDPAYVLTCGVPRPSEYAPTAECSVIAGVGWYAPPEQVSDQAEDISAIALSLAPYVQVQVPAAYRAAGIDRALADLAPVLRRHLGKGLACL